MNWIIDNDLKKEQIVSISANETSTENADAVLVLIYRKAQEPSMTSLAGLKFELLKNTEDWNEQYDHLEQITQKQRIEVISLTHTARNIG